MVSEVRSRRLKQAMVQWKSRQLRAFACLHVVLDLDRLFLALLLLSLSVFLSRFLFSLLLRVYWLGPFGQHFSDC